MYRFLLLAWVTFILHFQPSSASWNAPLVGRHLEMPQRRQTCDEGTGVSNQDQVSSCWWLKEQGIALTSPDNFRCM